MMFRRTLWAFHRGHLRYGALMWVGLATALVVIGLAFAVASSGWRLQRANAQLDKARTNALRGAPIEATIDNVREPLPLPSMASRFDITQRILKELQDKDFAPEQIRFKFEHAGDAGVTREIAVFSVKTHWNEIAGLLEKLQAADRSVYIARLQVARDSVDDDTVDADIQLAVALLDDNTAAETTP